MKKISEFDLIARLFEPLSRNYPGALGLLDDAAILDTLPGKDRVISTDCLICDVHFRKEDPPQSIAAKALGVNLSDLASMGATPEAYTMALAIPQGTDTKWLEDFAHHLKIVQDDYGIILIGGDTVSTPGPLSISITAMGLIDQGSALKRSGAQINDDIYVTGTIGDSALGLRVLQHNLSIEDLAFKIFLSNRYQYPQARTLIGEGLAASRLAHACCDISDGLIADLSNICKASHCAAEIDTDLIPLSPAVNNLTGRDTALWNSVLFGGDDYELLFTAPPHNQDRIQQLAKHIGTPTTRIGRVIEPKPNKSDPTSVTIQGENTKNLSFKQQNGFIHHW